MTASEDRRVSSELSLASGFAALAAADPDRVVTDGSMFRATRAQLMSRCDALSAALAQEGVGQGDRIAVWLPNSVEWIALLLAASRLGATIVALNMRYKTDEARYILQHSGASHLFVAARSGDTDYISMLRSLFPGFDTSGAVKSDSFPHLRRIVLLEPDADLPHLPSLQDPDWTQGGTPGPFATGPNDALVLLYTSGTTSAPKGVMVRESSLLTNARCLNAWMRLTPDDRVLLLSPFCGIYGINAMLGALTCGATCILSETTNPEVTLDLVETERVTAVGGTLDAIIRPWIAHQKQRPRDLSRLKGRITPCAWIQGDPMVEMPVAEQTLGLHLVHTYGLSEGTAMTLLGDPADDAEARFSGRLRPIDPCVEVKVVPTEDSADPEYGELCLRGPMLMSSYLDNPKATAEAIDADGWLHTGDFARLYPDGAVRYEGRIKDIIKVSGYSISPAEIEYFLSGHSDIADVQVVGVPGLGEGGSDMLAAFVVPRAGATVDRKSIEAFCKGRIATFKIPSVVRSVTEFPIAPSANADKVKKNHFRDLLIEEFGGGS